jgi:peptidoglycan/xylan/chitin deacetylase (PgdA/CDA1 family)
MFKFFFKTTPTLRVLMYHKVSADGYNDYLTVPVTTLEAQFNYLLQEGYSSILLSDLVKHVRCGKKLPPKPVLITFDDGYRDNYTIMYPLLKKYGIKANIFLVPSFLENEQQEPTANGEEYLRLSDIQAMDKQLVEYGLHSFDHKSYKVLSATEVDKDIVKTRARLIAMNIPFQPCLAFPYGAFPKRNPARLKEFFNVLTENKITLAFRIGNRLNNLPLQNPLLIQRLDIRGNDPFERFVSLLRRGKSIMDKV